MLGLSILSGTALLAFATAQTAPGFPIQVDKELSIAYGAVAVDPPGKMIPQGGKYTRRLETLLYISSNMRYIDTASPPSNISTPVFTPSGANGPDLGVLLMVRFSLTSPTIHDFPTNIIPTRSTKTSQ